MTLWLFDTNTISAAVRQQSRALDARLANIEGEQVRISAITYGEIRFGLAQKPEARRLARNMRDFLHAVPVLPWTTATAEIYGVLRADLKRRGLGLSPLDMLIAAHALEAGATLVSSDRAFRSVPDLTVEDWSEA